MRLHGEQCRSIVSAALAEGYRHIDTARSYDNEEDVGAGIRQSSVPRDEIVLVTKVWHTDLAGPDVEEAAESSLRRLGTDYVDVLLVHWPSRAVPLEETLEAFAQVREQGKARFIGVGNFPSTMFEGIAGVPGLIGNQVEYHPYLGQDKILTSARSNGLVVTAYCPLGRAGDLLQDPLLQELAGSYGKTVPQIVLRWLIEQDRVAAIPGTSDPGHLRENVDVFDFELSPDDAAAISSLARGARVVNPPHAPDWD
ncbi:MAG: aldo/keto reductase [Nitriliruptorales bacterium]|nr:aldo/keto reductase [Nitriliruptorales bacterium]